MKGRRENLYDIVLGRDKFVLACFVPKHCAKKRSGGATGTLDVPLLWQGGAVQVQSIKIVLLVAVF